MTNMVLETQGLTKYYGSTLAIGAVILLYLMWELFGDSLYKLHYEGMGVKQECAFTITELRPRYNSLNYVLSAAMMAFALWHGWPKKNIQKQTDFMAYYRRDV
jgi:hypothetical protein